MTDKEFDFVDALNIRIDALRPTVIINPKHQVKGVRFKDTEYLSQAIQGCVLVCVNPSMKGLIYREAGGLEFDSSQVLVGLYDPLIKRMLSDSAHLDFKNETKIDLH